MNGRPPLASRISWVDRARDLARTIMREAAYAERYVTKGYCAVCRDNAYAYTDDHSTADHMASGYAAQFVVPA